MAKIEVKNLYKIFGRNGARAVSLLEEGVDRDEVREHTSTTPAVIDASFSVSEGELFVIMGLSGSGKSTLLRCLNLLHRPTAGAVSVDGQDITEFSPKDLRMLRAQRMNMVFQSFGLLPHRTVRGNVEWGLEVLKVEKGDRARRAREALRTVGLEDWEDMYPGQLSGGMQQRVGIARAFATDADILLMDEAFSALDPLIRAEMQELLMKLQRDHRKTIVFITHDLNEAMKLGDRIAMMRDGRIVQIGTTEEILNSPADDYVRSFVQGVDRSRVLTAENVMEEPIASIIRTSGPRKALREMRLRQISALLVVDEDGVLQGSAFDDEVVRAIHEGSSTLDGILHHDVATVAPETPLNELLVPSAESRLPLAVVKDGRLLGVIPRVTLLDALSYDDVDYEAALMPDHTTPEEVS